MVHHPRARAAAFAVAATLLVVGGSQWISPQAHSAPAGTSGCKYLEPLESTGLYQVPTGVDRLLLEVYGRGGDPSASDPGSVATGRGVTMTGWIGVTQGDVLSSSGAAWFRKVGNDLVPVLEAGGGGSPALVVDDAGRPVLDASGNRTYAAGGDAGLPGQSAQPGSGPGGGGGATPTAGGAAGVVQAGTLNGEASAGVAHQGGDGGTTGSGYNYGGRGGDGYFGGGGGAALPASGGGGGSSYVAPEVTLATVALLTSPLASHLLARASACSSLPPAVTAFTNPLTQRGYVCTGSTLYTYTGQPAEFTVPAGEQVAMIQTIGALGGGGFTIFGDSGGAGGAATGYLAVKGGQVLQVRVGGRGSQDGWVTFGNVPPGVDPLPGGYNGGGDAMRNPQGEWASASGGGASDVRVSPYGPTQRVVVGGGGGGGYSYLSLPGGVGGLTGGDGTIELLNRAVSDADINAVIAASLPLLAGTGGTSQGPGVNGLYRQQTLSIYPLARVDEPEPNPARDPAAGVGGSATVTEGLPSRGVRITTYLGGGGGWYGGGAGGGLYVQGGHEVEEEVALGGSAGGGSSYAVASPAGLPAAVFSDGVQHGDGLVRIATCHQGAKVVSVAKPASTSAATATPSASLVSADLSSVTPAVSSVGSPSASPSGEASRAATSVVPVESLGEPAPWWVPLVAVGALAVLVAGGVFFVLVRRRRLG